MYFKSWFFTICAVAVTLFVLALFLSFFIRIAVVVALLAFAYYWVNRALMERSRRNRSDFWRR